MKELEQLYIDSIEKSQSIEIDHEYVDSSQHFSHQINDDEWIGFIADTSGVWYQSNSDRNEVGECGELIGLDDITIDPDSILIESAFIEEGYIFSDEFKAKAVEIIKTKFY